MKRVLLATTILLSAASGWALAADLPAKAPIYAPPAWSWSGFYLGAAVGGGWGDYKNAASAFDVSVPLPTSASGILAGIYGGYNYMLWDKLLIGLEADISYANIKGSGDFNGKLDAVHGSIPWAARAENELSYLGTVRGRVGYAFGRLLPYATGGLAYGNVKTSGVGVLGSSSINSSFAVPFSGSSTQVGWAVGGGVEYAVTNNLLARVEYLYYDLGTADWIVPNSGGVKVTTDANGNLVRAGVAYKF